MPNPSALYRENRESTDFFVYRFLLEQGLPSWMVKLILFLSGFTSFVAASIWFGGSATQSFRHLMNRFGDWVEDDGDVITEHEADMVAIEEYSALHLVTNGNFQEFFLDGDIESAMQYDPTWPGFNREDACGRMLLLSIILIIKKLGFDSVLNAIGERFIAAWLTDMIVDSKLTDLEQEVERLRMESELTKTNYDFEGENVLTTVRAALKTEVVGDLSQNLALALSTNSTRFNDNINRYAKTSLTRPDEVNINKG